MTSTSNGTAVGVFPTTQQAQRAVQELKEVGFRDDQIGVAARNGTLDGDGDGDDDRGSKAATGAMAGVATGAGVGGLWALGIAAGFLPAIGPVIAGGIFASLLASAAAGAAAGGLVGMLVGLGIPEDEAEYYHGEFQSGKSIVTVRAADRRDEAVRIFRRYGGTDASARSSMATGAALNVPVAHHDVATHGESASGAITGEEIRVAVVNVRRIA